MGIKLRMRVAVLFLRQELANFNFPFALTVKKGFSVGYETVRRARLIFREALNHDNPLGTEVTDSRRIRATPE